MAAQNTTDSHLLQCKNSVKHSHNNEKTEEEKRTTSVAKFTEAAKPVLEDQALLREKLKNAPTWKRDQDIQRKRQTQPMVARPPSPGASTSNQFTYPQQLTLPSKPPSPPMWRRTPGNSPVNSLSSSFSRSSSPLMEVSSDFKRKLEKATRARLYLLQQTGPNSFLIGGDSPDHKFKVMIGQQTCSCGRPCCVHLLFVMARVFKVKENDPLLWSQKLKNYEVESLFKNFHERVKSRLKKSIAVQKRMETKSSQRMTPPSSPTCNASSLKDEEEVCPICLLEMVEGESLTSCRGGCNNRLHQHCMEIWFVECRRQKEALICPLCRKIWTSDSGGDRSSSSPQRSPNRTVSPNVPCPLGPEEITLPHSNPIPAGQVDLARPWVEAFGEELVSCLFSREWNIRETALRRLSKDISTEQSIAAFEACCSLLSMMCSDPVYRVYYAAVRTIRMMMVYISYSCPNEKQQIQNFLEPVVEAILTKCADSNRRFNALSIKVLLEMCKDQEGDFALGKMLEGHETQELGGLNYILYCILKIAPEYAAWPWWLGRLYFLRRLTDEYTSQLQLVEDYPQAHMETVGVLVQEDLVPGREDSRDIYRDNLTRLMSVVKFAMQATNCRHSKVAKLSVAVLMCCANLATGSPTAFVHVKNLVLKLKPAQRSILQRRLSGVSTPSRDRAVIRSDSGVIEESHGRPGQAEFEREQSSSGVSSAGTTEDISEGAMSLNLDLDETDNMTEEDILSFVESFTRPSGSGTPPSSLDLDLDWSRTESPRYPPVKLGKKCKDLMEQEEAEAIAKAIDVSMHERVLQRIPSLQPTVEEQMVIVYSQPESLDKAVDTKHLYLEGIHWKKGELLGTGAFSSCYAVRDVMSGSLMAVKQVSFCRNSSGEQEKVTKTIMDEITMMAKLQHPRLINCLGATQHAAHYNIFLEWMPGGSISTLLSKYGAFEDTTVTRYSQQILQGVAHLHQHGVIHRDIKGANILVDATGRNIRIADFGAAARLSSQFTGAGEFQGQLLGTIAFMAPEVLRGESYGRSCDLWSTGCVMIEMATGKPPWDANEHSNHLALIFKIAGANAPPEVPDYLTPAIRDVILRCLEPKNQDRPTARDLLKHPLFTLVAPGPPRGQHTA